MEKIWWYNVHKLLEIFLFPPISCPQFLKLLSTFSLYWFSHSLINSQAKCPALSYHRPHFQLSLPQGVQNDAWEVQNKHITPLLDISTLSPELWSCRSPFLPSARSPAEGSLGQVPFHPLTPGRQGLSLLAHWASLPTELKWKFLLGDIKITPHQEMLGPIP